MAGTIIADTLQDGSANSGSMTDAIFGSAKAWVNFNGTGTVAIRDSYNVSSITDDGVGQYTVNFTTAMADTNYAFNANASNLSTLIQAVSAKTKATGSLGILTSNAGSGYILAATYADTLETSVTIHGGI